MNQEPHIARTHVPDQAAVKKIKQIKENVPDQAIIKDQANEKKDQANKNKFLIKASLQNKVGVGS